MALGKASAETAKAKNQAKASLKKHYARSETIISSNHTVPSLEGDYILIRFSSLLPHISCKNDTDRYNHSSIKENQPRLSPCLIPGDSAVILPIIIPVVNRGWSSSTKPLFDMIGLEEVECLNPSMGGPAAGQCQFACVSTALSDSFISLGKDSRLDLELRRLALRVIETNPSMYQDFLTSVSCYHLL